MIFLQWIEENKVNVDKEWNGMTHMSEQDYRALSVLFNAINICILLLQLIYFIGQFLAIYLL